MAGKVIHQDLLNTHGLVVDRASYYKYTPTSIGQQRLQTGLKNRSAWIIK